MTLLNKCSVKSDYNKSKENRNEINREFPISGEDTIGIMLIVTFILLQTSPSILIEKPIRHTWGIRCCYAMWSGSLYRKMLSLGLKIPPKCVFYCKHLVYCQVLGCSWTNAASFLCESWIVTCRFFYTTCVYILGVDIYVYSGDKVEDALQ